MNDDHAEEPGAHLPSRSTAGPRRKPKQARSRRSVEKILRAARELLIAEGAEAFNTNRVAKLAGVGIGTLYQYFPGKQAIVERLIEDLADSESSLMLDQFAEIPTLDQQSVAVLVRAVFALYVENLALYRVLWAMADQPRDVGHRPNEQLIMEALVARLEPMAEELGIADTRLAVFTVFHLVESLCERFVAGGTAHWTPEQCQEAITTAAVRYLRLDAVSA